MITDLLCQIDVDKAWVAKEIGQQLTTTPLDAVTAEIVRGWLRVWDQQHERIEATAKIGVTTTPKRR